MTPAVAVWQIQAFLHCRQKFVEMRREAKKSVYEKEIKDLNRRLDQAHRNNNEYVKIINHLQRECFDSNRRQPYNPSAEIRNLSVTEGVLHRLANSQSAMNQLRSSGSLLDAANRQR